VANRRIGALFALIAIEALVASIASISAIFVPIWAAFIITVSLAAAVTTVLHRKIKIEVHEIYKDR
jgi:hypothetical protein